MAEASDDSKNDLVYQLKKATNEQREWNKQVKNEDAQYKLLAFNAMIDREKKAAFEKAGSKESAQLMFENANFADFYRDELKQDIKRDPRPINEEDYTTRKKSWEKIPAHLEYLNEKEREEAYRRDHGIYLENKKE